MLSIERDPGRAVGACDEIQVLFGCRRGSPARSCARCSCPSRCAPVDRDALGVVGAGDEAVVDVAAVEVGAPDRAPLLVVRPVDVLAIDGDPECSVAGRDEALIHAGAVVVRATNRRAAEVGPVDVLAVDGDPAGARSADERRADPGGVEVCPSDRAGAEVSPVDRSAGLWRERQRGQHSSANKPNRLRFLTTLHLPLAVDAAAYAAVTTRAATAK